MRMRQQLLHTPEGVRDIYNMECEKKLSLQNNLHSSLQLYGYHDIQTPTFEYFDVFRKEIGTISSKELYKFFDRDGNTLVLRPDITPSIARAAATLYEKEDFPVRLCYMGNTFINHSSYQGLLKENTQLGAELIGDDSIEADAEMLALVVDSLKKVGLEDFQVSVGHVDFFQSLMDEANLEEDVEEQIRELIINRNYFGVEELLDQTLITPHMKEIFHMLPELVGGKEVLQKAMKYAPNIKATEAISRLISIYDILKSYGAADYVSFDLSTSGTYGYYTGIIFRGYTFGTGDAVVKGGRYDHLIEKFGQQSPSIGFAIVIDELMSALTRQKINITYEKENTLIVYEPETRDWAISLARDFREKGKNTELVKQEEQKSLADYITYGKRNLSGNMLYLKKQEEIVMINLHTDEEKIVPWNNTVNTK